MIAPNFDLMLWIILILWITNSLTKIPILAFHWGETQKYGWADVGAIIITLILVAFVLVS